jgi:hypothetical protein
LYNKNTESYYGSDVQAQVYCGKIFSDQGTFHDCGISFHTWLSDGKTMVWSPTGHDKFKNKEQWGTCRAMYNLWFSSVAEIKARRH